MTENMTVTQLREALAREGYDMDRSVRKPQLVAYLNDLINHRHAEALAIDEKITSLREWRAAYDAPAEDAPVLADARGVAPIVDITPLRFLGVCEGPHFIGRDYVCGFGAA
jgi:hypothetical protein